MFSGIKMRPNFGTIPNYNLVSNYAKINMEKNYNDNITDKFDNSVRQSTKFNQNEFKESNSQLHNTLSELFYQNDNEIPVMSHNDIKHNEELEIIKDQMEPEQKETFEEECKKEIKKPEVSICILFIVIIVLLVIVFLLYYFNNRKYQKMLMCIGKCKNNDVFRYV